MELLSQVEFTGSSPDLAEYTKPAEQPQTIVTNEHTLVLGDDYTHFLSLGFRSCSGLIIRSENKEIFGLFHATEGRPLTKVMKQQLGLLRNGQFVLARGSNSFPQPQLLKELVEDFDLTCHDTINIEVPEPDYSRWGTKWDFDLIFEPSVNKILVATYNPKVVSTYKIF